MRKAVIQGMQDTMEILFRQFIVMGLQQIDIKPAVIECLAHGVIEHLPEGYDGIQFIIRVNRDGTMNLIKVRLGIEPAFRLGCDVEIRAFLPALIFLPFVKENPKSRVRLNWKSQSAGQSHLSSTTGLPRRASMNGWRFFSSCTPPI